MAKAAIKVSASLILVLVLVTGLLFFRPYTTYGGSAGGEVASACPANQFALNETASGALTCATSPNQFDRVGLVGWWPLDEGTGTSAYDMTPNGNTGTLTNSPTWQSSASCKSGDCLRFLGSSSQYVSMPSYTVGTGSVTMCGWFKTTATSSEVLFGVVPSVSSYAFVSWDRDTGFVEFVLWDGTNVLAAETPFASGNDGNWHLACGVRNVATGKLIMYVDTAAPNTVTDTLGNIVSNPFRIGYGFFGIGYMTGSMDDVRLYNRALSATEVSALFAEGNGALPNPVYPQSQSASSFVSDTKSCTDTTLTTSLMMGFKLNYTTHTSGRIGVTMVFTVGHNASGGGAGAPTTYKLTYGTGNAPACNSAATGTPTGNGHTIVGLAGSAENWIGDDMFAVNLAPNTTYWFDVTVSDGAIANWTYSNPEMVVTELS